MPGFYEITFLPEGRVEEFADSCGDHYEFPDGTRLDLHSEPAWCRACGGLGHAEQIPSLEQIDKELADLRDPSSESYRMTARGVFFEMAGPEKANEFLNERIEELRRRRRWREGRTSPPKCIRCGSTDVVLLPYDEPIPHPAGEGTIELRCVGMCSTSFNEWFFTPEGDRIPRDTKPTYWHHPAMDDEFNKPGGALKWLRERQSRRDD